MSNLQSKKICVTGAGQGLGRQMALTFARQGALLLILDLDGANAEAVAAEIRALGGPAVGLQADLAIRESAHRAINDGAKELGGLDALVNNAVWARYEPIQDVEQSTLDRMLDAGVKTAYWSSQAAVPWLAQAERGAILNLSSVVGITGVAHSSAYALLKAGMDGMTRALAAELGQYGIRVNSLAPSAIPSPMSRRVLSESGWESRRRRTPLGRIGNEQDVADVAAFLLSDSAGFITGEVVRLDGGFCIGTALPGVDLPAATLAPAP